MIVSPSHACFLVCANTLLAGEDAFFSSTRGTGTGSDNVEFKRGLAGEADRGVMSSLFACCVDASVDFLLCAVSLRGFSLPAMVDEFVSFLSTELLVLPSSFTSGKGTSFAEEK